MTFYWWSHWFWITLLSNILLSPTMVLTYPSQEAISLHYNQYIKSNDKNTVTKLHQATTVIVDLQPTVNCNNKFSDFNTSESTVLHSVILNKKDRKKSKNKSTYDGDDYYAEQLNVENYKESKIKYENFNNSYSSSNLLNSEEDNEIKRSAVVNNNNGNNSQLIKSDIKEHATNVTLEERNNYTNFSINSTKVSNISTPLTLDGVNKLNTNAQIFSKKDRLPALVRTTTDEPGPTKELQSTNTNHKMPFILENVNKNDEVRSSDEHRSRKSKGLTGEYRNIERIINYSTDTKNLLTRSAFTTPIDYDDDEGNVSSEALAVQRTYFMDVGGISVICFTVFGICCAVATLSVMLYRRRYLNKPQTLSEPDSSVYIDDSTMRDNSDEMYSLDNDSFLNSLEAMTIQNYWTDTVKHTKL